MERLISFLMSNIGFVIIIVGIIYTMFFRKSPLERRSPNRMPDFGGDGFPRPRRAGESRPVTTETRPQGEAPSPRPAVPTAPRRQPDWMETRQPRPRNEQPEQPQRMDRGRPQPVTDQRQQPDRGWTEPGHEQPVQRSLSEEEPRVTSVETVRMTVPPQTDHTATGRETARMDESGSNTGAVLTQENLSRAVMWAEILGPPRSRRRHRRS